MTVSVPGYTADKTVRMRTLFLGGLREFTEPQVRSLAEQFGKVTSLRHDQKSHTAFVMFASHAETKFALSAFRQIDERFKKRVRLKYI